MASFIHQKIHCITEKGD
uniref:Uncharacterized protein n=1 Tax=Rhizophora mucronata TaxID=61149 RepID=A0A2P2R547_RHIMU